MFSFNHKLINTAVKLDCVCVNFAESSDIDTENVHTSMVRCIKINILSSKGHQKQQQHVYDPCNSNFQSWLILRTLEVILFWPIKGDYIIYLKCFENLKSWWENVDTTQPDDTKVISDMFLTIDGVKSLLDAFPSALCLSSFWSMTWGVSLSTSSSSRLVSQFWKIVTLESMGTWTLTAISVLRCIGSCPRISFSRIIFLLMWRCWYQLLTRCRSSLVMWWLRR